MCFYTTVANPPSVAHRDMVCYKVLDENMCSWIQGFEYTINKVYKTELETLHEDSWSSNIYFTSLNKRIYYKNVYRISRGFHSYQRNTKQIGRIYIARYHRIPCVFRCIIPKGSLYYKNQWGEYVSDQIVIKEKVNFK